MLRRGAWPPDGELVAAALDAVDVALVGAEAIARGASAATAGSAPALH